MRQKLALTAAKAVLLPLALAAPGAHAVNIVETLEQDGQFSTLTKALMSADLALTLSEQGPFTVFAPTDRAFEQLPNGVVGALLEQSSADMLRSVLGQHVVEGQELTAQELMGKTSQVSTLRGDKLTVDGTGQKVVIVPTGLQISRIGDQLVIQREVATLATPSMAVRTETDDGGSQGQDQQRAESEGPQTQGGDESQMQSAAGEGQAVDPAPADQQVAAVPASPHQEEVTEEAIEGQQGQRQAHSRASEQAAAGAEGQQAKHEKPERTAMPSLQHQEEVLAESELEGEQRQYDETSRAEAAAFTSAETSEWHAGDPEHRGALREAQVLAVNNEPDNGVIYAIDRVLLSQEVASEIEMSAGQEQSQQATEGEDSRQ